MIIPNFSPSIEAERASPTPSKTPDANNLSDPVRRGAHQCVLMLIRFPCIATKTGPSTLLCLLVPVRSRIPKTFAHCHGLVSFLLDLLQHERSERRCRLLVDVVAKDQKR